MNETLLCEGLRPRTPTDRRSPECRQPGDLRSADGAGSETLAQRGPILQLSSAPVFRWAFGFTLVELLVVVAIIALLAALLLPALRSARERSKQVLCVSRMKQLAMGLSLYADDSREYLPAIFDPTRITPQFPTGTHWNGLLWELQYVPVDKNWAWPARGGSMNIFVCPSWEILNGQTEFIGFSRTLGMFQYQMSPQTNSQQRTQIRFPSGTPLIGDSVILDSPPPVQWYAIDWITGLDHLLHMRHSGRANVAWADGSVRPVRGSQYSAELQPPLSTFINYYFDSDGQIKATTPHN